MNNFIHNQCYFVHNAALSCLYISIPPLKKIIKKSIFPMKESLPMPDQLLSGQTRDLTDLAFVSVMKRQASAALFWYCSSLFAQTPTSKETTKPTKAQLR